MALTHANVPDVERQSERKGVYVRTEKRYEPTVIHSHTQTISYEQRSFTILLIYYIYDFFRSFEFLRKQMKQIDQMQCCAALDKLLQKRA